MAEFLKAPPRTSPQKNATTIDSRNKPLPPAQSFPSHTSLRGCMSDWQNLGYMLAPFYPKRWDLIGEQ